MAHLVYKDRNIDLTGTCVIGRQKGNDVVVLDEKASREHCRLVQEDESWFVEDLGSANGTRVNGVKIDGRSKLRHGDRIGISRVVISFIASGSSAKIDIAAWDHEALVGQLIGGMRLIEVLGRGTLAAVYKARQLNLDRTVAIKIFHPGITSADKLLAEEIRRYTLQAGRVTDSGIASIHECGNDDGMLWYSMEFVDGEPVEALLERDGKLEWDLAVVIAERVSRALSKAHAQNLIHQGISPKSVFLSSDGRVKVLELGLATLLHKQQHLFKAERSQHHMAPEQLQGNDPVPGTDAYAIGCLLFHLIAGRPPFAGAADVAEAHIEGAVPRIRKLADCPDEIDRLLCRLLAKLPEDRPSDLAALADDLRVIRHQHANKPEANRRDSEVRHQERLANVERRRQKSPDSNSTTGYAVTLIIVAVVVILGLVLFTQPGQPPLNTDPAPAPEDDGPKIGAGYEPIEVDPDRLNQILNEPVPTKADPIDDRAWKDLHARVTRLCNTLRWSEAERAVLRYQQGLKPESDAAAAVDSLLQQVRLDARLWYDQVIAELPKDDDVADLRGLIDRLTELRRQVLPNQLSDITARLRGANRLLQQRLSVAGRRATQLLESGKASELPALAAELAPIYKDTHFEHIYRSFAARCQEAAKIPWLGDWAATSATLLETKGEAALAAAAACFLTGDSEAATTLLLGIDDPQLRKRRDLLIGSSATTIRLGDLNAMNFFEVHSGEPRLADGALVGTGGEATEVSCNKALRGRAWECRSSLTLPLEADAELVVNLGDDKDQPITIRFNDSGVQARLRGGQEQKASAGLPEQPIDLLLRQEDGQVSVIINGSELLTAPVSLPPTLRYQLTATGRGWRLHEIQLIGISE